MKVEIVILSLISTLKRQMQLKCFLCKMQIMFLDRPFPASFFIFVCATVNSKRVQYKILLMSGFELLTSGIGGDCSANRATAHKIDVCSSQKSCFKASSDLRNSLCNTQ